MSEAEPGTRRYLPSLVQYLNHNAIFALSPSTLLVTRNLQVENSFWTRSRVAYVFLHIILRHLHKNMCLCHRSRSLLLN